MRSGALQELKEKTPGLRIVYRVKPYKHPVVVGNYGKTYFSFYKKGSKVVTQHSV